MSPPDSEDRPEEDYQYPPEYLEYQAKRQREIEITEYYREKCRQELAKEGIVQEALKLKKKLEFRAHRRLNNPKWHTEEHTSERTRKKAWARSKDWTREEFYKMKNFDWDNASDGFPKTEMYNDFYRYGRTYSNYGVSPGKSSYITVRSTDSDILPYDFASADARRQSVIQNNIDEALKINEVEITDLTTSSPSRKKTKLVPAFKNKKKLSFEIDPDNCTNEYSEDNIFIPTWKKDDLYTNHCAKSLKRLRKMTPSPPPVPVDPHDDDYDDEDDEDEDDEDEDNEDEDEDGYEASAVHAVSDVVNVDATHGGNEASAVHAVSDVVNVDAAHSSNDASAVHAVSDVVNVDAAHGGNDTSAVHAVSDVVIVDAAHGGNDASAVHVVSDVVNVDAAHGGNDASAVHAVRAATTESSSLHSDYSGDDLIDRLMARCSKKKGETAPVIQARVSKRAHVGKVDMDKPCSCGCGRRPSEKSCPLCGSFTRAISMHCWMKGQVCSFCRNHNKK